jgi:hypothetical protein
MCVCVRESSDTDLHVERERERERELLGIRGPEKETNNRTFGRMVIKLHTDK